MDVHRLLPGDNLYQDLYSCDMSGCKVGVVEALMQIIRLALLVCVNTNTSSIGITPRLAIIIVVSCNEIIGIVHNNLNSTTTVYKQTAK